jgi:hypothetical protein
MFKRGERVRIMEDGKGPSKTYVIKKIFESDDGIPIYLLKSETDPALRLYHETEDSSLEKIYEN